MQNETSNNKEISHLRIKYYMSCSTFLFPGNKYLINVNRLLSFDRETIVSISKESTLNDYYIFMVNNITRPDIVKGLIGYYEGVIVKLVVENGKYYFTSLAKAHLYNQHKEFGSKIVLSSFIRESGDFSVFKEECTFNTISKNILSEPFKHNPIKEDKLTSFDITDQVKNILDHIVSIDNISGRQELFSNFDKLFYLIIVNLFVKTIQCYTFNGSLENNGLVKMFDSFCKNYSPDEDENNEYTSIILQENELTLKVISSIKLLDTTFKIEDAALFLEEDEYLDYPSDNSIFAKYLYLSSFDYYKEKTIDDTINKILTPISLILESWENAHSDDENIQDSHKEIRGNLSLFDVDYQSSVLWDKKVLNTEDRKKVYYDFIQMDLADLKNNYDKLEYIPKVVRNTLHESESSGSAAEREKRRLLSLIRLPWEYSTKDNEIKTVKEELNNGHYGMEKVKTKILEYLTMVKYSKDVHSKIICLYGPPGVGKSSIAKNIAKAMGRSFCKLGLGSISSELDIQGLHQSFSGATPGGIINGLIKAGCKNPVFLLDELDKVPTKSTNANITGIIMNILDSSQNTEFVDSFLNISYDLSDVLFICTANDLNKIPAPLINRVEIIEVEAYTAEDKQEILKKYSIPTLLERLTIDYNINFTSKALELITTKYALDSGMRESIRSIETIISRTLLINEGKSISKTTITENTVVKYLGEYTEYKNNYKHNKSGIINILSASSIGGKVSKLEVNKYLGDDVIKSTGNLGKILSESIDVAVSFIKSNLVKYDFNKNEFENYTYHFHFSENSSQKDGPSGGVSIVVAMYSIISGKIVPNTFAFTGEVTLKGKVLPIGGIINKLSACVYENVKTVFMPLHNKKEVEELSENIRNKLTIIYVDDVQDVLNQVFNINK